MHAETDGVRKRQMTPCTLEKNGILSPSSDGGRARPRLRPVQSANSSTLRRPMTAVLLQRMLFAQRASDWLDADAGGESSQRDELAFARAVRYAALCDDAQ